MPNDYSEFTDPNQALARSGTVLGQIGQAQEMGLRANEDRRADDRMSLADMQFQLQQQDFANKLKYQDWLMGEKTNENARADAYLDLAKTASDMSRSKLASEVEASERALAGQASVEEFGQKLQGMTPEQIAGGEADRLAAGYRGGLTVGQSQMVDSMLSGLRTQQKVKEIQADTDQAALINASVNGKARLLAAQDGLDVATLTPDQLSPYRAKAADMDRANRAADLATRADLRTGASAILQGDRSGTVKLGKDGEIDSIDLDKTDPLAKSLSPVLLRTMQAELDAVGKSLVLSPEEKSAQFDAIRQKYGAIAQGDGVVPAQLTPVQQTLQKGIDDIEKKLASLDVDYGPITSPDRKHDPWGKDNSIAYVKQQTERLAQLRQELAASMKTAAPAPKRTGFNPKTGQRIGLVNGQWVTMP